MYANNKRKLQKIITREKCKPFGTPLGLLTMIIVEEKVRYLVTQLWDVVF
jgi:hypothetical protein